MIPPQRMMVWFSAWQQNREPKGFPPHFNSIAMNRFLITLLSGFFNYRKFHHALHGNKTDSRSPGSRTKAAIHIPDRPPLQQCSNTQRRRRGLRPDKWKFFYRLSISDGSSFLFLNLPISFCLLFFVYKIGYVHRRNQVRRNIVHSTKKHTVRSEVFP